MKRKPGEPIYLKRHMLGLATALLASFLLPLLYHRYIQQLSFSTRFIAGLLIATTGAIALYFTYRASAQNEP
ncbi:MAG: hypothetical protein Q7U76_12445 [Nitrospirota bacterium]|nr:hypothetical protein [Nitrospirota bacterium]